MTAPLPRTADYLLLIALGAIWGASFMFIKVAVLTVPPVTMTLMRVAIGAVIFVGLILASGRRLPRKARQWRAIALAAVFGLALPFSLISWGEARIDSGLAAILMAGMPLMTIVLAHFLVAGERLTVNKLVGVGFGIAGLVILIGPDKLASLGADTVRQLAVVGASLCYAINAILMKRLSGDDPYAISAGLMLAASAMLLPFSLAIDAPWRLSPALEAWFAVAMLGVFPTALASLVMLAILRRQGASFFSQINFMVPLFGVFWGFLVLAERPPAQVLAALAVILAGIAITRGGMLRRRRAAAAADFLETRL